MYGSNSRFVSDQVDGSNTVPLAQIIASKHLVMANLKNKNKSDPRNYKAAQGEARATREEPNLENEAQPWQSSEQPSSSSTTRWNPSPAADVGISDTQRRHEAWRDQQQRRRETTSSSEWSWDHQNWSWEQTPTWAQVYASQSTWDEPYHASENAKGKRYRNDDYHEEKDERARSGSRKG